MGKGGGSAPQPTTQTVQQSNIPEYARPYFEDIMTRGQAASQVQYQPYTGERVAPFSPLQQQAFEGVQNLGPSPLIGAGAGMTGVAGIGGLGAGQQYQQMATDPNALRAYMSPYMQNVVDFQKSQAIQDYGRQLPGQQAAATRAGAFGGSRQAIVEAEAQRNLQNQLAGIQAQGSQSAFDAARQSQQFGANLGLQGLGLAGQMGQQFGQLGQQAFGQQAAALEAQQRAGAIQQAQGQQQRDLAYEEFMRQQLYPQSQLQFLSSLLRGSVVAPQQTMYTYQQQPSAISQIGGLGLGALGISKAFGAKEGGEVPGYADGGITGDDKTQGVTPSRVTNVKKQLLSGVDPRSIPDPLGVMIALQDRDFVKQLELTSAAKNQQALEGGRQQAPSVYDEKMGEAAGLAGMDAGVMEEPYAGGGIVAFSEGGDKGSPIRYAVPEQQSIYDRSNSPLARAAAARKKQEEERANEIAANQGKPLPFPATPPVKPSTFSPTPTGLMALTNEAQALAAQPTPAQPTPAQPTSAAPQPELLGGPTPKPAAPAAPVVSKAKTPAPPTAPKESEEELANRMRLMNIINQPGINTEDLVSKFRDEYGKKFKDRGDEIRAAYLAEADKAKAEGDKDRWLAIAMGGFAAAAGDSPYALKNLAQGFGLAAKEAMAVNQNLRKADAERKKAERLELQANQAMQLELFGQEQRLRDQAEQRNLTVQKLRTDAANILNDSFYKSRKIASDEAIAREGYLSAERRTAMVVGGREGAADKKDPLLARSNKLALAVADGSATPSEQAEYASLQEQIRKRSEATKTKAPSALKPSDVATATAYMNAAIKKNDLVSAKRYADMLGIDLPATGGRGVLKTADDGVLEYKPAP